MTLNKYGEPVCDTCHRASGANLESSLVMGWGYWKGQDGAGREAEFATCPRCRGYTHSRPKSTKPEQDETLF